MKEQRPRFTRAGMLRFFLKGSLLLFAASIAANLFGTLLTTLIPQVISFSVDSVIGTEEVAARYTLLARLLGGVDYLKSNLWLIAVFICALALFAAIFHYLRMYLTVRANQTLMRRMRNTLFSHIQRLPLSWHHARMTGDIIQRCTSDADTISDFISRQLITLFRVLLLTAFSIAMMFLMNALLAAIAALFVCALFLYSVLFYRRVFGSIRKCDENEGILSTYAQENFSGARVVRAFGREAYERKKFGKQNEYYTGLWVRAERFLAMFWTTSDLLVALQLLVIITLGAVFCVNGSLTLGDLLSFIMYNTMLMEPVRQLGRIISNLSKAGVSTDRIAEIMNAEEEDYGKALPLAGDIVFDHVNFSYEGGERVLRDICLTVPEGSTLGVIGPTGSGKSTLVSLLDRLYPLESGQITIGGKPLEELSPATLRKNIGLILQEGHLFSRTVGENIAIAAEDPSFEDIRSAARTACVDENIEGFAKGYDTVVGERGVTLSGGQKQRVAIARTMLRNTPYLIFDDSLSAVDSDTDVAIRANLKEAFRSATVIIVSHRVTTVMHADKIVVLEGGRITEEGTHEELYERGGLYRRICDVQMSLPEELKEEGKEESDAR